MPRAGRPTTLIIATYVLMTLDATARVVLQVVIGDELLSAGVHDPPGGDLRIDAPGAHAADHSPRIIDGGIAPLGATTTTIVVSCRALNPAPVGFAMSSGRGTSRHPM